MSFFSRKLSFIIFFLSSGISISCGQKIFMTGDSHVFSKIYPQKVEEVIREEHPDIDFSWWAKNGICFYSFNCKPEYYDSLFSFKPDILIVHLGTNGAYANNFRREKFREEMERFYTTLTDTLSDLKVIFITPFTNKKRRSRKKGRWYVNNKNRDASDEIISFVADHPDTFVIDHNAEVGTKYLTSRNLIRPDNVHLTEAGYSDMGDRVARHLLQIEEIWTKVDSEQ